MNTKSVELTKQRFWCSNSSFGEVRKNGLSQWVFICIWHWTKYSTKRSNWVSNTNDCNTSKV